MNNKSIGFVCLGFNPEYGGNFIESLISLGKRIEMYNIIFILSEDSKNRSWINDINNYNFKIEYINTKKNLLFQINQIKKIINKEEICLLHFHFTKTIISSLLSRYNNKLKIVVHNHSDWSSTQSKIKRIIMNAKDNFIYHIIGKNIKLIAVSRVIAQKINAIYIPNGLVLSRIKCYSPIEIKKLKGKYHCNRGINFLIFAWSPFVKGLDIAVNSIGILNERKYKVNLLIVCGKSNINDIKQYINNNCKFSAESKYLKYLPPTLDSYEYFSISDAFISASRSEGFSYCLMEAISIGLPSFVSDISGTKWAKKYDCVEFVSENFLDLSDKIMKMINCSDRKEYETNKYLLINDLSIDKWIENILKIYEL